MAIFGHGCLGEENESNSSRYSLQNFKLYETQMNYYLIGRDKKRTNWRVLKVDRQDSSELNIHEDPTTYTCQDIDDLLRRLREGNNSCGGVKLVTKAYGIVGFIKFLKPYYMILITKRQQLGLICGHSIFGIRKTKLLRVLHPSIPVDSRSTKVEARYKRLFESIDLSKGFFYSHTYQIMWSLQRNVIEIQFEDMPFDDMFVWNSYLTREFRRGVYSPHWIVALVHGFFKQVKLVCKGHDFTLTLIARRSRHFAGTRYLKRGVNAKGRVANDVETEQLVFAEKTDEISSIVQHRGSIPLFWSQETSVLTPKPDIILNKTDPRYEATKLHFQNLADRYGNPIVVLNLVKTKEERPREIILCREYASAVAYLNHILPKTDRIKFIQCDMHMFLKRKPEDLLDVLVSISAEVVDTIGFFQSENARKNDFLRSCACASNDLNTYNEGPLLIHGRFQHGVLRSNCIDCLDRTNVSQYAFGLVALGRQMHALGLYETSQVERCSSLATSLMDLYEKMGDDIALQYGGSLAHNKVFLQWQGRANAATQPQELFRSLIRHYNNAVLDGEKQDAINIFLGHFRPEAGKLSLWEMDSDNQLLIRRAGDDPANDMRLSFKRSLSAGNVQEQIETAGSSEQLADQIVPKTLRLEPLMSTRRRLTIGEAELREHLPGGHVFLDVRHADADAHVLRSYSSMDRSVNYSQSLHEFADAEWTSSAANSCEEDLQERQLVTPRERVNSIGSELLSEMLIESEDSYNHDDYFQSFMPMFGEPLDDERREHKENSDGLSGAGAEIGPYSEDFEKWIIKGQTLTG